MMEPEGVSKDPRESSMPIKAMPKLVRLEGRSFPRNQNKDDSTPTLESKLKDDIDGPIKSFGTSGLHRKPYRRTHEEIEDFVAKRQRKTPVDRANNPKLFSYSTNKTDIASIEKPVNRSDPLHQRNGKELYQQPNIRKGQHDERGYDYLYGKRHKEESDNDLSRVNFIPGSSKSKLLNDRARYKYLQPSYSSSISINGNPLTGYHDNDHSLPKNGSTKEILSDRSVMNPTRLVEDRSHANVSSSDHLGERDRHGVVNLSNRYNDNFGEQDKPHNSTSDPNLPLNLQKTFANIQGKINHASNIMKYHTKK